jgi:hypothetical protein
MAVGIRHADRVAPSIRKKLAITSPTSGGRSVGTVRSRTQTMEFSFFYNILLLMFYTLWSEFACVENICAWFTFQLLITTRNIYCCVT